MTAGKGDEDGSGDRVFRDNDRAVKQQRLRSLLRIRSCV